MPIFGKKFQCEACGMRFGSEGELQQHSKVHMQPAAPRHQELMCQACGVSFHNEGELKQHAQLAHSM